MIKLIDEGIKQTMAQEGITESWMKRHEMALYVASKQSEILDVAYELLRTRILIEVHMECHEATIL